MGIPANIATQAAPAAAEGLITGCAAGRRPTDGRPDGVCVIRMPLCSSGDGPAAPFPC